MSIREKAQEYLDGKIEYPDLTAEIIFQNQCSRQEANEIAEELLESIADPSVEL